MWGLGWPQRPSLFAELASLRQVKLSPAFSGTWAVLAGVETRVPIKSLSMLALRAEGIFDSVDELFSEHYCRGDWVTLAFRSGPGSYRTR